MSTEKEKYLKLKGELESLNSRIIGVESEGRQLQAEAGPAEHEALKFEIAEHPQAKDRRAAVRKAVERMAEISVEVEAGRKRMKAMMELLPEFRVSARQEIQDACKRSFQKPLTAYAARLREAAKARAGLNETYDQITRQYQEIDVPVDGFFEKSGPLAICESQYAGTAIYVTWERYLEKMKALGFDVD